MQIPILKLQSYRPPDFLAWKMEKSLVSQDFSLIVRSTKVKLELTKSDQNFKWLQGTRTKISIDPEIQ